MSMYYKSISRPYRLSRMQQLRLEEAKEMYRLWIDAEKALTTSQSYTIGTRTLTRVDLAEVREAIKYWLNEIAKLENLKTGAGRAWRVIPRDL